MTIPSNDPNKSMNGSSSVFTEEMAQYVQVYIDESEEELEGLVEAILKLESNPRDSEALNKSFRMLHSLKGSSGMLGFEVVGNFAHELEDRFERYRSGKSVLDPETTTLILQCLDYFRSFLERLRSNDASEGDPAPLLKRLQELEGQKTSVSSSTKNGPDVLLHSSAGNSTSGSSNESLKLPAMTVSGGLQIVVRFRTGLQLADLKARLIVSRLSSIGEIISCEPPIDDAHSFEELPLFSLTLVTDRKIEDVRKVANVDGVESIEIKGGGLMTAMMAEVAASLMPTHAESSTNQPAAESSSAVVNSEVASCDVAHSEALKVDSPSVKSDGLDHSSYLANAIEDNSRSTEAKTNEVKSGEKEKNEAKTDGQEYPSSKSDNTEGKSSVSETLRVDIGRLDRLMNLTGELVVANARFTQIAGELNTMFRRNSVDSKSKDLTDRLKQSLQSIRTVCQETLPNREDLLHVFDGLDAELASLNDQAEIWEEGHRQFSAITEAVDQLTRVSKNLQRGVLNTRMVPVGPLFNRFKRVIRDLSVERKKDVRLSIQGEKTELDKRMIDALGDPLLHLVRNSVDHGLESSDVRRQSGKPEYGTIFLEAAHRGNNVWITVRDDGSGIDAQKIRNKLVSRGLATEAQVREMTEQQVISQIWNPGFSTAEKITEISGRGVGMDIVRNAISELNGTIDVASAPGEGTTFTIRLPLTLAIIHCLLFRFCDEFYSIPIDDVREIVSIPRDQVHSVHRHLTIDVRGELVPLVSMNGVFLWSHRHNRTSHSEKLEGISNGMVNVIVLHGRGKTLGLSVDSLVGRGDMVIKSLSENFVAVRGLSGASILGDGSVCLMLDSSALIELASSTNGKKELTLER